MPNNLVLPTPGAKPTSRLVSKPSSRARPPAALPYPAALATLTLGKASRVFAAFVSFHYLQDRVALPLYLFFVTMGAAATLLLLQRPWTGKRIGGKRTRRVLLAGGLLAATLYLWTAGLRSAGPLRTLLVDGAELPLLYVFALATRREMPERRRTRGAVCMLLAYCLLVWDASGHVPDVAELERSRIARRAESVVVSLADRTGVSHVGGKWAERAAAGAGIGAAAPHGRGGEDNDAEGMLRAGLEEAVDVRDGAEDAHSLHAGGDGGGGGSRRRLLTTFRPPVKGSGTVKDAFVEGTPLRCEVGVVLVLIASVLLQASRGFSRRLSAELGGAKRHFALSTTAACIWVTPLALLSWLSSATGAVLSLQAIGGVTRMAISPGHVLGFVAVGFLWLVLPYYVRAIVSTAVPQRTMVQSGVVVPFLMAVVVSVGFGGAASAGGVSWVLCAAFVLECVGVSLMMAAGVKRSLSELPIDDSGSAAVRTTARDAPAVAEAR